VILTLPGLLRPPGLQKSRSRSQASAGSLSISISALDCLDTIGVSNRAWSMMKVEEWLKLTWMS
jgi:hypothetical protein